MRQIALCVSLALALTACERSTEADSGSKEGSGSPEAKPAPSSKEPIRSLPEVDTSSLDDFAKGIWTDMVNELLSPCGEPVSVARCISEKRKCKRCVPAARYVARLVNEGYSRDEIREIYRVRYGEDTKIDELIIGDSPLRGSPMAPVTIYEFSDFQCPHCKLAAPELKKVVEESDGKAKLVFKHYPLPMHPKAREAAKAAVAADKQGKFWEMHDLVFENQMDLSEENLYKFAATIGLDQAAFKASYSAKKGQKIVEQDKADGEKLGISGTPAVFVNGREVTPALFGGNITAWIDDALKR